MTTLSGTSALPVRLSSWLNTVRVSQWWGHKIPPVIGAVGFGALVGQGSIDGLLGRLLLLVVSAIGLATFGHLLNDWCDITSDALAGKTNRLAPMSPQTRAAVVVLAAMLGLVPWAWLPMSGWTSALLGTELALFVAYSVPPFRLKSRGLWGVAADAGYAYAVPFLLAGTLAGSREQRAQLALLGAWGLVVGGRSILYHQLEDRDADELAGVQTAVYRMGEARVLWLIGWILVPLEVVGAIALVAVAGSWWLTLIIVGAALYRCFQVALLGTGHQDQRRGLPALVAFQFTNPFVEQWLPLGCWVALAIADPGAWWVVVLLLILFDSPLRQLVLKDAPFIPDAVTRTAFSLNARTDRRILFDPTRHLSLEAPRQPTDHSQARSWVFVVCGPADHLATLHRAVRHLRAASRLPIWWVTDRARNDYALDDELFDRVVDVSVPNRFDNHQASIWLKTSLPRHVGTGSWCYLDSDVLAVASGVDAVFAEPREIVGFASDLTVDSNCVDRFSPWAMNCECTGMSGQHSCGHLRSELERRFGLEVPGDWVHWNGGVFTFDRESQPFFDQWHDIALTSFGWHEWKTRDQGALIATVWLRGLSDAPRLDPRFNFIADTGNSDLVFLPRRGWAHHPDALWYEPQFMHLYASRLEDPAFDLVRDLEAPVLRASHVRLYRYNRSRTIVRILRSLSPRRLRPGRLGLGIRRRFDRLRRSGPNAIDTGESPAGSPEPPGHGPDK